MNLRRKKTQDASSHEQEPQKKQKGKPKGLEVGKFEVSEDKMKFFVAKGFGKKKWVLAVEIPILEVEQIEGEGNALTVTWKGVAESFHLKDTEGTFAALVDQVNLRLEEQRNIQQQTSETNLKNSLRSSELLEVINKSIDIVDLTFNLLIALQDKRINWQQIEAFADSFSVKLDFTGQTLPALNLDYSKIAPAVKTQVPKDASNEAFSILKAAYGYFEGLKPDEDIKENLLNIQTAKTLIYAYYLLNDLLLGRFVGDKDNGRENSELETALQNLVEANFNVDVETLKESINLEGERQTVIEDCRAIFKEELKQLGVKREFTALQEPAAQDTSTEVSGVETTSPVEPSTIPSAEPAVDEATPSTEQGVPFQDKSE